MSHFLAARLLIDSLFLTAATTR